MNECPLCHNRVSDWMMASGKTTIVNNEVVHNSCMMDFHLKHGKDYRDVQHLSDGRPGVREVQ